MINEITLVSIDYGFDVDKIEFGKTSCGNCKHEMTNMECGHPLIGTAKFSKMKQEQCFSKRQYAISKYVKRQGRTDEQL